MQSIGDLASDIMTESGMTPTAPAGKAGSPDISQDALSEMGILQEDVDYFITEAINASVEPEVVKETTTVGSLGVNLAGPGKPTLKLKKKKKTIYEALSVKKKTAKKKYKIY